MGKLTGTPREVFFGNLSVLSVNNHGHFPFDQKFRFKISKISRDKWNSKWVNFPVAYTSPVGPNRSIQFQTEISRKLRQRGTANRTFFEWNRNFLSERSDRKKRSTSKGGPSFPKIFRLDRTVPFSSGPEFPDILVDWKAPHVFCAVLSTLYRKPSFVPAQLESIRYVIV